MIIELDFANDLLELIEKELNEEEDSNQIYLFKEFGAVKSADLEWMRKYQDFSFPVYTTSSTNKISISKEYYEILVSGWENIETQTAKAKVKNLIETDISSEAIYSAIQEKISKLVYQYDKVLKCTIETNRLFGIEDEEKILLIHLKKYQEILNSQDKQIYFFHGITLSKGISDKILRIYVRFIKLRLEMINPISLEVKEQQIKLPTKFTWKGSQKDLCELFIELSKNNWIEDLQWGDISKSAKAICHLFDLCLTKRNENSDVENSFYQILKGKHNPSTKKREYDEILGNEKNRKFNKIKKNISQ